MKTNTNNTWHCQETIGGWRQVAVFSGTYEECRNFTIEHNWQYAIVADCDYEVDYL